MENSLIESSQYLEILKNNLPIIDVRAPVEFEQGSVVSSVNLPLMNNDERHQVGLTYKEKGQEAAVQLGFSLISGEIQKTRLELWKKYLKENKTAAIMCFRGGLRSRIVQQWCQAEGIKVSRIAGGYKALRQLLAQNLETSLDRFQLTVVSGTTGSAKTKLLQQLQTERLVLDLEEMANHRGSAFGGYNSVQPSQASFENRLSQKLLQNLSFNHAMLPLLVEDESRLIGKCVQPEKFFAKLRSSGVVVIQDPLATRVENTFQEYIVDAFNKKNVGGGEQSIFDIFYRSLKNISARLGGARYQEVLTLLKESEKKYLSAGDLASNRLWIEKLLQYYYDPIYLSSFAKRKPRVLFSGTYLEVLEFLKGSRDLASH